MLNTIYLVYAYHGFELEVFYNDGVKVKTLK